MARGEHIVVDRGGWEHHGVDLGDGTVVHFADAVVRRTSRWRFAGGNEVRLVSRPTNGVTQDQAVTNAVALAGAQDYALTRNNCEHLASWAVTGVSRSRQIEEVVAGLADGLHKSVTAATPAPVLAWVAWEFGMRLGRWLRERLRAAEFVRDYRALWVGDSWEAPDGAVFVLDRQLRWMARSPTGSVPIAKPTAGTLGARLWIDPMQTLYLSDREGGAWSLVGDDGSTFISIDEMPPRSLAPTPTLLRRSDSVFTAIERHGLPTPLSWEWPV